MFCFGSVIGVSVGFGSMLCSLRLWFVSSWESVMEESLGPGSGGSPGGINSGRVSGTTEMDWDEDMRELSCLVLSL